jgi:uncharacterized protein
MSTISIIVKGTDILSVLSIREFEKLMNIEYLPVLFFEKQAHFKNIQRRCERAMRRGIFTRKQKWLSRYYEKEILSGALAPGLLLQWVDSFLGYGVFAEQEIAPQTFIGEYTGLVRERKFRESKVNDYCFEYSFGDFFKTPFLIDAEKKGNLIRFINHSAEPNLEPIALYADGVIHVILISTKRIPPGTQLTYDYGHGYWLKRSSPLVV